MDTLATVQDDSSGANPSSIKSDDSSPQHEGGTGSPPPNCAICLGTCKNKSFTDSCLHQFCFSCLLTWSKVKAECPLCKQAFRSIIHNVRSNHQYEEYLVVQRQNEETSNRIDIDRVTAATQRFRYRTTLTLPRRETIAIQQLLRHYPFMADVFPPTRAPPARRRRSPASFRRTVYRHNLWARPLPDFTGRFRDCSPDFYSYNSTQMHRLVPWLNRELYYLLNENAGHITYVISRIIDLLPQHHINSPEFRENVQRYFGERTEHFLHELFCFASTPYDLAGYDRNVQYTTDMRISTMVNEVISSSDSDATVDSDIVMVSSSGPADPPPGPSRIPAPVYPQSYISQPTTSNNVIPIETISHSDTDDDSSEVMVVGYIKPPQDRTPEIVDLLGSDSDVIVQDVEQSSNPVKVTLKRHRTRNGERARSDSDSSYEPSERARKRRRCRRRSDASTTSDEARNTPDRGPAGEPAPLYLQSSTASEFSSTDEEPRQNKRAKKRSTMSTRNKRRTDNRSSQTHRENENVASAENGKRSRKSYSGKGVKSSNKSRSVPAELTSSEALSTPRELSTPPECPTRRRSPSRSTCRTTPDQSIRRRFPSRSTRRRSPSRSTCRTTPDPSTRRRSPSRSTCRTTPDQSTRRRSPSRSTCRTTPDPSTRRRSPSRSTCRTTPDPSTRHRSPSRSTCRTTPDPSTRRRSPSRSTCRTTYSRSPPARSGRIPPGRTCRTPPGRSINALDQPSTSGTQRGTRGMTNKEWTNRLRSVVNIIYNSTRNQNTDESNSNATYRNFFAGVSHDNHKSEDKSVPAAGDARSERAEAPHNRRLANSSSDSEDNIPLNLTLQKKHSLSST